MGTRLRILRDSYPAYEGLRMMKVSIQFPPDSLGGGGGGGGGK